MSGFIFKTKNKFSDIFNYIFSKKFLIDKFLILALFITIQVNDLLVRSMTVGAGISLKPFLSNIIIVCLSMVLLIFIPKKWQSRGIWFFIIISSIIAMANYAYFNYFGRFLTLGQLQQTGQLGDVKESIYQVLSFQLFYFLVCPVGAYFIYRKIHKQIDLAPIHNRKGGIIGICTAIIIVSVINVSLITSADISRISKLWNRELVVGTFGIYTYQFSDAYKVISNKYFVDIESEGDAREEYNEYFTDERMQFVPNEYTGIFEGRDVYYIHYESAQNFLVNETINGQEVLPVFNRLAREGVYFNNVQSQESYGTSSDSEFTISSSTLPLVDGTAFVTHANKDYLTTERLLNDSGYTVNAYHGNKKSFWNRDVMLARMGYDEVIGLEEFEYTDEDLLGPWGLSDESFYRKTVEQLSEIKAQNPDVPVFAKLITLTNHHTFAPGAEQSSLDLGNFGDVNLEMNNYIKSYNYVDSNLQVFFDEMDAAGLLDNAVVVLYGDHNAPLPTGSYEDYVNYDFENNVAISSEDENYVKLNPMDVRNYKSVPVLIWTKDGVLPKQTINNVAGLIDVGPTVNNLLGIHNPYQFGRDLLSTDINYVSYPNGSWLTDQNYYSGASDKLYGIEIDEETNKQLTENAERISTLSRYVIYYNFVDFDNPYIIRYEEQIE